MLNQLYRDPNRCIGSGDFIQHIGYLGKHFKKHVPVDVQRIVARKLAPKYVRCAECGKRFKPCLKDIEDGYRDWAVYIPPHKVKIKKSKRTSRDIQCKRVR